MSDKKEVKKPGYIQEFFKGVFWENPTFVVVLGLCPTLAVTTQTINGAAMGVAVIFVLVFSNMFISMLRNWIPDTVRIPSYIVIVASFVTVVSLLMQAFTPDLFKAMGIFIPLIVVNCIILGRAEAFANRNTVGRSILDGFGMGLGFGLALTLIGAIREFLGSSMITLMFAGQGVILNFGNPIMGDPSILNIATLITDPALVMIMPPGGFLVMGLILAFIKYIGNKMDDAKKAAKKKTASAGGK